MDKKSEHVLFVGYGISSLIKVSKNNQNQNKSKLFLLCYEKMRLFRHQIAADEYRNITSANFQIQNSGGMVIPHDHCHEWGEYLLSKIRCNISLERDGNDAIIILKKIIFSDEKLRKLFDTMWNNLFSTEQQFTELYNDENIKKKIYIDLTSKVLHSRANVYVKCYNYAKFSRCNQPNNVNAATRREFLKQK